MVLSAVFLPMAFFGGSTGVIYRQFSITIVSAMALSVIVALILTPALCATMLKPIEKGDHGEHKGGFFGWFNRMFLSTTHGYERGVASILKHRAPYLLIYVVIVAGMIWMFTRIPTAFLPDEDQAYCSPRYRPRRAPVPSVPRWWWTRCANTCWRRKALRSARCSP